MLRLKIVKHAEIDEKTLIEICEIKATAWPYSIDQQKDWIKKNLSNNDQHVLLYDLDIIVGYLNLVDVEINLNGTNTRMWGIGNVCTKFRGKGYGASLLQMINTYLVNNYMPAILFCNQSLVSFYQKYNWILVPHNKISFPNLNRVAFETMLYNTGSANMVVFNDRLF